MNVSYTYLKGPKSDYYQFRWRCLRKPLGMPPGSEQDELEEQGLHFLAKNAEDQIIACCRADELKQGSYQLRYMAVDESCRGQGIGRGLLSFVEKKLLKALPDQGIQLILNARHYAVGFYEKCGFTICSPVFQKVGLDHYQMEKTIG